MKKQLITLILIMILAPPVVWAQENAGLLPTNPFYFLKEWRRGIKLALSFNAARKAEVALDILDEKAAEVKKLDELGLSTGQALENYLASVEEALARLRDLPLTDKLADKILSHAVKYPSVADFRLLSFVLGKIDSSAKFTARLETLLNEQSNSLRELRLAALLERWPDKFLPKLTNDLLIVFTGRLEANLLVNDPALLEAIAELSNHATGIVRVLDQIRELAATSELKNQLNVLRQQILDSAKDKIGEEEASAAIQAARDLLEGLGLKAFLDRGRFNLSQAEIFFESGNYSAAFAQASAAVATAKSGLIQQYLTSGFDTELTELKARFDKLSDQIRAAELAPEKSKIVKELFAEAQERILRLSKSRSVPLLRHTKLLLAIIDELGRD